MSIHTALLGDVVSIKGGGTPSKAQPAFYTGNIPWVTPKDMKSWDIITAQDMITDEAVRSSATNVIPENGILIVNRSGILKHTLPVGINRLPVAINQDIKALICGPLVEPDYLARIIKAAESIILGWVRATTADNFPIDNLRELEIPLPSFEEQKRIAAILDQADSLRRLRQRTIDRLNSLGQAIFSEMFGDPATNPRSWPIGRIDDLTASTQYGTSGKAGDAGAFPILRMGNIKESGAFDYSSLKYIDLPVSDVEKYTVRDGDILFNRTNSPDLVGKTGVYRGDKEYAFAGYLVRLRTNDQAVPEYIGTYLNSPVGKKTLRGMCKAIIGMANINAKELRTIPIPLVPIDLQREFQQKVFAVQSLLPSLEEHRGELEILFSSLQHRAFSGDL